MTPEVITNLTVLEQDTYPSLTYKLDLVNKRIGGYVDEKEAVIQAITKILLTERYAYVIYDYHYGVELESLVGQDFGYVISDLQRRLEEALLVDDRILELTEFNYTRGTDSLVVEFTVNTIYGEIGLTTEVNV